MPAQVRTNDRPRFRQDLVAEAIDDQGARYVDVADPDSGSLFRFFEVEYSLACAMDGQRDVAGIVQWAREELGVTPSPAEVRTVIATLDDLGFIDGVDRVIEAPRRETPAARAVEVPGRHEAPPSSSSSTRDADPELAPGVVVGNRQDTVPGTTDLELGEAGATGPHAMPSDMPAAPDLMLGAPGATTPARHAPADDIALGMPGPGEFVSRITEPEIEIQRGPSKTSMPPASKDVSLDLADQMSVRPDDVKEAVRASKVMKAVEVPRDLLDAMEAAENDPAAQTRVSPTPALRPTPVPPPRRTPPPMPAVAPPVDKPIAAASSGSPASSAAASSSSSPSSAGAAATAAAVAASTAAASSTPAAPAATPASARAPTPLPLKPPAEKQPLQGSGTSSTAAASSTRSAVDQPIPVAPRRTSPAVIVVLVLILAAAVAFAVWYFVLQNDGSNPKSPVTSPTPGSGSAAAIVPGSNGSNGSAGSAMQGSAGSGSAAMAPAPAKAKLATEAAPPEDLKAPVAGTVETIEANDKVVKAGDIIARLAGHKPIETEITQLQFDVDKRLPGEVATAQKELSDAKTANNGAGETAAQKKVDDKTKALDDKKAQLAAKQTELDKFVIKAASAGKLAPVAKQGAKVNADDVIAKIARDPMLAATFEVKGTKPAKDATVKLSNDASPDKTYDCTVVDVAGDNVKVTCPSDPSLDGAAVTLQP